VTHATRVSTNRVATMFTPTGLLGLTNAISPVRTAEDTQKLSIGLTGQSREEILNELENLTDSIEDRKVESISSFSFVTNGLPEPFQEETQNEAENFTGMSFLLRLLLLVSNLLGRKR